MAITRVQHAGSQQSANSAAGVLTSTAAGTCIFVAAACDGAGNTDFTISDGVNTYVRLDTQSQSNAQLQTWVAYNIAGGTVTITATLSGASLVAIAVAEYSGVVLSSGVDQQTNSGSIQTNPPIQPGSITTTAADDVIITVEYAYLPGGGSTIDGSYSIFEQSNQNGYMAVADWIPGSTQTTNPTWSNGSGQQYLYSSIVALKAAAGSGAIAASIVGGSVAAIAITAAGLSAAALSGQGSVTAATVGAGQIAAVVVGSSTIVASAAGSGATAAALSGQGSVSAPLAGTGQVAASVVGTAVVTASAASQGALAASITGTTIVNAVVAGAGAVSAPITGTSIATAALAGSGTLVAGIIGSSSVVAALVSVGGAIAASIVGISTVIGAATGVAPLTASIVGSSTTSCGLDGSGRLFCAVTGTGAVVCVLVGLGVNAPIDQAITIMEIVNASAIQAAVSTTQTAKIVATLLTLAAAAPNAETPLRLLVWQSLFVIQSVLSDIRKELVKVLGVGNLAAGVALAQPLGIVQQQYNAMYALYWSLS